MRIREFAKAVDHTLLAPDAREQDISRVCEEAAKYHFAAVCIPPAYVPVAAKLLRGVDVKVATVISFPFGYEGTVVKAAAVREAINGGALEVDVVMNISKFLSGEFNYVAEELAAINQEMSAVAIHNGLSDVVFKVIIEAAYLNDDMKRLAVQMVAASGADFVKTSTGFGPGGAVARDVTLLRQEAPEGLGVKASGGIRTLQDAIDMLNAGASRLGMSSSVDVMKEAEDGGLQE